MSSTNHTTNYNLPQFVGSDKPAWLGDINPAMSAIDTAIHNASTTASQGVSDASTAQNRADSAYDLADGAKTDASTAQGTANQAIANSNTNAGKITALENKFNLSTINTISQLPSTGQWSNGCNFTLAQNSDGSVFKFYGTYDVWNNSGSTINVQKTPVSGMTGFYGIATGLFLNTAPDEAYTINPAGICWKCPVNGSLNVNEYWTSTVTVGTDGQIYIYSNDSQTEGIAGSQVRKFWTFPCIYFNTNWGDEPQQ